MSHFFIKKATPNLNGYGWVLVYRDLFKRETLIHATMTYQEIKEMYREITNITPIKISS